MNHTLAMNFMIVCLVLSALVLLQNPLALFGLMFLMDMPYSLHPGTLALAKVQNDSESDDDSQAIGFTQDVR